jgi:uncharacterized protein YdaU (DUF1376 family)
MSDEQQPPAFLFFVNDFIVGTKGMTPAEVGIYVLLLAHEWRNGGPIDLWKTCGSISKDVRYKGRNLQQVVQQIAHKFRATDEGLFFSPRLEEERRKLLKRKVIGRSRANGATREHGKFASAKPPAGDGAI